MTKNAQILSVLSQSQLFHPDSKREMQVYVVSYITEDGHVGETSLFFYTEDIKNKNILEYPLQLEV